MDIDEINNEHELKSDDKLILIFKNLPQAAKIAIQDNIRANY